MCVSVCVYMYTVSYLWPILPLGLPPYCCYILYISVNAFDPVLPISMEKLNKATFNMGSFQYFPKFPKCFT